MVQFAWPINHFNSMVVGLGGSIVSIPMMRVPLKQVPVPINYFLKKYYI
jgi:hypothetical protein